LLYDTASDRRINDVNPQPMPGFLKDFIEAQAIHKKAADFEFQGVPEDDPDFDFIQDTLHEFTPYSARTT